MCDKHSTDELYSYPLDTQFSELRRQRFRIHLGATEGRLEGMFPIVWRYGVMQNNWRIARKVWPWASEHLPGGAVTALPLVGW